MKHIIREKKKLKRCLARTSFWFIIYNNKPECEPVSVIVDSSPRRRQRRRNKFQYLFFVIGRSAPVAITHTHTHTRSRYFAVEHRTRLKYSGGGLRIDKRRARFLFRPSEKDIVVRITFRKCTVVGLRI